MSAADDIKKAFDEGYEKGYDEGFTAGQYDARPEYEEISAENVAINLFKPIQGYSRYHKWYIYLDNEHTKI